VARIETEKLLISMVDTEISNRTHEGSFVGHFKGQSHFFGYFSNSTGTFPMKSTSYSLVYGSEYLFSMFK
jgi:pyrophosphate--fructose-6-phosphate 1-phosphotransferase